MRSGSREFERLGRAFLGLEYYKIQKKKELRVSSEWVSWKEGRRGRTLEGELLLVLRLCLVRRVGKRTATSRW